MEASDTRAISLGHALSLLVRRAEYYLSDEGADDLRAAVPTGYKPLAPADLFGLDLRSLSECLPAAMRIDVLAALNEWDDHLLLGADHAMCYLVDGRTQDEAVDAMRAGIQRAYDSCGSLFERLGARCHAWWEVNRGRADQNQSQPPARWNTALGRQELKLVDALWGGEPKSFAALHNTAWCGKEVTDQAIEKAVKRANEKIETDGFTIIIRNEHAQLEKLADK